MKSLNNTTNKSPATPVVKDAATLFYCDAPEMFRGQQSLTQLSIGMTGE